MSMVDDYQQEAHEAWDTDARRSVERARTPAEGILKQLGSSSLSPLPWWKRRHRPGMSRGSESVPADINDEQPRGSVQPCQCNGGIDSDVASTTTRNRCPEGILIDLDDHTPVSQPVACGGRRLRSSRLVEYDDSGAQSVGVVSLWSKTTSCALKLLYSAHDLPGFAVDTLGEDRKLAMYKYFPGRHGFDMEVGHTLYSTTAASRWLPDDMEDMSTSNIIHTLPDELLTLIFEAGSALTYRLLCGPKSPYVPSQLGYGPAYLSSHSADVVFSDIRPFLKRSFHFASIYNAYQKDPVVHTAKRRTYTRRDYRRRTGLDQDNGMLPRHGYFVLAPSVPNASKSLSNV
ncbi:hypothetical protein BDZ89DRAFT_1136761 [Hymenopellis radicata]|nr:hypothetical protein BDZ89DRAFT_1136761 [Hymenopellis radicata]